MGMTEACTKKRRTGFNQYCIVIPKSKFVFIRGIDASTGSTLKICVLAACTTPAVYFCDG